MLFIAAFNQDTRGVGFIDYWSQNGTAFGPGEVNRGDFRERIGTHASLTIQTTPDVAQKALDFIKKFNGKVPDYNIFSSSCTTACRAVLELAGISALGEITPSSLWANLYSRYSFEALHGGLGQRLLRGSIFSTPMQPSYAPGREFGNPRNMGSTDWQRYLFNLWIEKVNRQREEERRRKKDYEVDITIRYQ